MTNHLSNKRKLVLVNFFDRITQVVKSLCSVQCACRPFMGTFSLNLTLVIKKNTAQFSFVCTLYSLYLRYLTKPNIAITTKYCTYRGSGEIGGVYLPSQLELTPQICT